MRKKNIYFFKLRNETKVSGEYVCSVNLIRSLRKIYNVININKKEKRGKYISFQKFREILKFSSIKINKIDKIILKIPTSSQIPFLELFLYKTKIKRIYLVDGLNFKFSNLSLIKKMILVEPKLLFQRCLLNNILFNFFLKFTNIEIVLASEFHRKKLKRFINKKSKIHIIENFNKITRSRLISKDYLLGYFGHNYPVKGLDLLAKASNRLTRESVKHTIYIKKPLRGEPIFFNFKNQLILKNDNMEKFMSKVNTFIFPFSADYGTNVYPSVIVEAIYRNKNLILPDFEIFTELVNKNNYQKKTLFFKRNDYIDLAKKLKLVILQKKKFKSKIITNKFNHRIILQKWKKILK